MMVGVDNGHKNQVSTRGAEPRSIPHPVVSISSAEYSSFFLTSGSNVGGS